MLQKTICAAAAVSLCLGLSALANAQTADPINFATTYQTIRGYGTSTAWQPVLNSTQANNLFGTGPGEVGLTILRSRIDPSSTTGGSNWQTELQNAQQAQKINSQVIVFATPWTPPAVWKTNGSVDDGSLNTADYDNFANYLNAFIAYEKAGGVNLYAISVQNEPDFLPSYESCGYTGAQMDAFIAKEGGKIQTKLMMPESDTFNTGESDPTLNDSSAVGYVSIVAGHTYGTNPFYYTNAKNKGKDVWMTETTYTPANGAAQPSISDAISAAELYHQSMAVAQYNAYVYWWTPLLLNGNSPNYYAYALGQYSKFVRPGYVMTGANNNPTSGVYVTSYAGSNNYVIVAINANSGSSSIAFNMSGATVTSMTPYQTNSSGGLIQEGGVSVSNDSFTYSLPGQSITTFVSGEGSTGGTTPEAPYGGTAAAIPGTVMAENYDTGGQGVAYNVTSTNGTNNAYRTDGVDLETATAPATSNDLGWTAAGQWFNYTVNVATAGTYNVSFLVSGNTAVSDAFHLSNAAGTNLSGNVAVPSTGGWQDWTTVTASVTLPAGKQTLTLNEDNTGWNIDSMAFSSNVSCTTAPSDPTGLTATAQSSSAINLSWSAVTAPSNCTIAEYKVYRGTTSGFVPASGNQIASVSSGTAFSDTGLSASTTYYYVVEAVDAEGSSSASTQASAETQASNSSGSFTLAASANSVAVTQGASATDTVTVTDANGFSGSVSLGATGLPSGVTANFGTNPTTGSSVVTFTAGSTAAAGTSIVTITGTSGTLTASTSVTLTVNASTNTGAYCHVVYAITSQWSGGFGAGITLENTGTANWSNWTLTWTYANGQTVTSLWNGTESQSGANVTVSSLSYNGAIAAGGSYSGMGFNGSWNNSTNSAPASFAVNGNTCQ